MNRTKLTRKAQTSVPKAIRDHLGVGPGDTVEWHIVEGKVVVRARRKLERPGDVLLSSPVRLDVDAVKLVRKVREDFA